MGGFLKEKKAQAALVCLIVLLYFLLFLFPTLGGIKKYKKALPLKENEWSQFIKLIEEHQKFKEIKGQMPAVPIIAFVEDAIKQLDLAAKMAYLKPADQKEEIYILQLENITSPELISFLCQLQNNFIKVNQLNLKDYEQNGLWNAKIYIGG